MIGIQYDAVPIVLPSGPNTVSALMRGRYCKLSGWRCSSSSSRVTARGAAGGTACSPSRRFNRYAATSLRGTLCMLVCIGFQAARDPSANSTRNESDDPPWFNLKRAIGCVRTRSSSSSSDIPRNVPFVSRATRRSGRLERSRRAPSGPVGTATGGDCVARSRAQVTDAARRRRSRRRRAARPRGRARSSRVLVSARSVRKFISLMLASSCYVVAMSPAPRIRLLHVPKADRRGRQGHQVLGQHLQLGAGEAGVLLVVVLGQPPAGRPPPQRLLHGRGRAPRGLRRPSGRRPRQGGASTASRSAFSSVPFVV